MVYRKVLGDSPLSQFQVDLWTLNKNEASKSSTKYVLLCIDVVSRFLMGEKLISKEQKPVSLAFTAILDKIQQFRKSKYAGILENQSIIFGKFSLIRQSSSLSGD